MKILWITNILPHFLAERQGAKTISHLGWLDYSAEKLMETRENQLSVLYPSDRFSEFSCGEVTCYTFPGKYQLQRNDDLLCEKFAGIFQKASPDIIHIYGTEYFHTYAAVKAAQKCELLDRTIISIQGLVSVCAQHYLAGLPHSATVRYTLRDILKGENLIGQMRGFARRGEGEIAALQIAPNVIGRTEWDKACTLQINPNRNYFFCNETLRKTFYNGVWDYDQCEKYSIFVSQSSYSIKGMHQVIQAMPYILRQYPEARIYVTGGDVFRKKWYRINSYHAYLKRCIQKLGLRDRVTFLGALNEEQMKARFLKSHVFVSASSIENSPNSVGEAMILGVPCVVSGVGGVGDVFTHKEDGFVYPYNEPYMLAHYVCRIFNERDTAQRFSANARDHARKTHDPERNLLTLCEIYERLRIGAKE